MVIPEYQHRDGKALLIVTRPRVFAVNLLCGREQYEELMSGIFKCDLIWMLSFFFFFYWMRQKSCVPVSSYGETEHSIDHCPR